MFTKYLSITGVALAAALAMGAPASAATVNFSKNYGSAANGGAQYGTVGYVNSNSVTVRDANDNGANRFLDFLDFSSITNTVESITLSLTYAGAGSGSILSEKWNVYAADRLTSGGAPDVSSTSTAKNLGTIIGSNTVTYILTDAVLSTAIAAGKLNFWFGESSFGADQFTLSNASIAVSTTVSAVPLPAGGLLLLGALGGITALRRRKTA